MTDNNAPTIEVTVADTSVLSDAELDTLEAEVFNVDSKLPEIVKSEIEAQVEDKAQEPEDKAGTDPKLIKNQNKTVPYSALHEERERRKAAQQELEGHRAAIAAANLRLQAFEQAQQVNKAPVIESGDRAPDFNDDPLGALKYHQDKLIQQQQETIKREETAKKQITERQTQETQLTNFLNRYKTSMDEYVAVQPDVMDAYKYLSDARAAEHKLTGLSDRDAWALVHQEEIMLASRAYERNIAPGEMFYNLAVNRGYKGQSDAAPKDTNLTKIQELNKGLAASKGFTSSAKVNPSSVSVESLYERLDDPNDKDVDRFWDAMIKGKL